MIGNYSMKSISLCLQSKRNNIGIFKKELYSNKPDLLRDIICMANNLTYYDGFIVIGIDEENDFSVCNIADDPNRRKTQDIVTFLWDKKISGNFRSTCIC